MCSATLMMFKGFHNKIKASPFQKNHCCVLLKSHFAFVYKTVAVRGKSCCVFAVLTDKFKAAVFFFKTELTFSGGTAHLMRPRAEMMFPTVNWVREEGSHSAEEVSFLYFGR